MLSFIKGEAVEFGENTVVIDNGGIGYELTVSNVTGRKNKKRNRKYFIGGKKCQLMCIEL